MTTRYAPANFSIWVSRSFTIYTLNEMGSMIWQLLDGQTDTQQIAATICDVYEVTHDAALQDVNEFLNALEAAGLVAYPTPHGA